MKNPRYLGLTADEKSAVERYVQQFLDADPETQLPPTPPSDKFDRVSFWCQAELFRRTKPALFYIAVASITIILPLQLCVFLYGLFVLPA
jgi:hypothetical protein